jgi:predicted DNA-binding protein YlxM (UPF0122 family)
MKKNISSLEKKTYYGFLLLIYKPLLTEAVRRRMQAFYDDDLSISEISQNEKVSRNAIFDSLSQGEKKLDDYEEKMQLFKKQKEFSVLLDELGNTADNEKRQALISKMKGEIGYGI